MLRTIGAAMDGMCIGHCVLCKKNRMHLPGLLPVRCVGRDLSATVHKYGEAAPIAVVSQWAWHWKKDRGGNLAAKCNVSA